MPKKNCHPDRSVAKWRDLLFHPPASDADRSVALPFVIPSAAEGSAVLRASPGNVLAANERDRGQVLIPALLARMQKVIDARPGVITEVIGLA